MMYLNICLKLKCNKINLLELAIPLSSSSVYHKYSGSLLLSNHQPLEPGWHRLWQAGKGLARLARLSSVSLGLLQSSVLSPQLYKCENQKIKKHCIFVAEMPKNNVFAQKNLVYGILVANGARISKYALWGQNSGSSQLVRIPSSLHR